MSKSVYINTRHGIEKVNIEDIKENPRYRAGPPSTTPRYPNSEPLNKTYRKELRKTETTKGEKREYHIPPKPGISKRRNKDKMEEGGVDWDAPEVESDFGKTVRLMVHNKLNSDEKTQKSEYDKGEKEYQRRQKLIKMGLLTPPPVIFSTTHEDKPILRGDLPTPEGRAMANDFMATGVRFDRHFSYPESDKEREDFERVKKKWDDWTPSKSEAYGVVKRKPRGKK